MATRQNLNKKSWKNLLENISLENYLLQQIMLITFSQTRRNTILLRKKSSTNKLTLKFVLVKFCVLKISSNSNVFVRKFGNNMNPVNFRSILSRVSPRKIFDFYLWCTKRFTTFLFQLSLRLISTTSSKNIINIVLFLTANIE